MTKLDDYLVDLAVAFYGVIVHVSYEFGGLRLGVHVRALL